MKSLLSSTPAIPCFVRNGCLFGGDVIHEGYTRGLVVGMNAIAHRAPTFVVLLSTGAKYDPVPLHGICWKECQPIPLGELCWWDCFSSEHSIEVLDTMRLMSCEFRTRSGANYSGTYMFTVKWSGGFADVPAEHKTHDFIKCADGHFAMMPNNKVRWLDDSFVEKGVELPKYARNTSTWSCEP